MRESKILPEMDTLNFVRNTIKDKIKTYSYRGLYGSRRLSPIFKKIKQISFTF